MSFFYNLNKRLADLSAKQDATHLAESKQAKTVAQSPLTQALNEAGQRRGLHGEPEFVGIPGPAKGTKPSPKAITKGADREYYKSPGLMGEPERTRWRKKVEEPKVAEAGYSAKSARAGHDIGKPGKNFAKIAKSASAKYGSKAAGERVAGAVLNKLRHPTEESAAGGIPTTPKQKSFAKLAPPADKITFADKIAGAKKEVDEMLGDVAAEAMKAAIGKGKQTVADEGNAFTGKLKSTPQGGKFKLGNKEFKDTSSIEEKKEPRSKGTAFDPEVMSKIEKEKDPHPRHDVKDTGYSKRYTRKHEDDVEKDDDDSKSNQASKYASPKKKGRPQSAAPKDSERVTKGSHKYDVVDGKRVKKVKENEEYDDEGSMAKGDMHTVIRHATELEKHLRDQENLPTWVIEKIGQIKGMMTSVSDYILSQHERGAEQATGQEGIRIAERSKSQAQARMMAGAAHDPKFAKKVGVKQSVAKEFNKADTGKKMSSLPKKVKAKEEVDETTTSGSVATATPSGKSSKGGMSFGKGVYESFNNSLEKMISESIDVTETVNEHEQEGKTITVTASGPEADMLMQLLKAAGLSGQGQSQGCGCGTTPCSCEAVDEAYGDTDETLNKPDWPTDTEKSDNAFQYSGGLNGPKSTGQTTTVGGGIPNMQARRQVSMEENVKLERSLFKTWKNYKG